MAVKHGNGKDWWIICRKFKSNKYYSVLVNNGGVQTPVIQQIGIPYTHPYSYNGVCNNSIDGTKYAFVDGSSSTPYVPFQVDIMDFDRCNGLFGNYQQILISNLTDTFFCKSVCFSPNMRFLYANDLSTNLWQFDLTATNIEGSRILVGKSDSNLIFHMQIAVDNKIYISPYSGASYLGVINYPNSLGTACDFKPYQFYCHGGGNYADGDLRNTPNFALGAIAPCGVGIEEVALGNDAFKIYPNPAINELIISNDQLRIKEIEVRNVVGQIVFNQLINNSINQQIRLDVSSLSGEIYFIKAADEKGFVHTAKFVKE